MMILLEGAGFDTVAMHGWTAFMTSSKTRGALFSARRPAMDEVHMSSAQLTSQDSNIRFFYNGVPVRQTEWRKITL